MRNVIRILSASIVMLASMAANAALINGTMTTGGNYSVIQSNVNDLTTVSDIKLMSVHTNGTAEASFSNISFLTPDSAGPFALTSLTSFSPVTNFFTYAGWQLDLNTLLVASDSSAGFLHLSGTGVVSGNGYVATNATWSFSANNATKYSMSVTALATVPVPAAAWLFGSGLIGLVGVARRKA